MKSARDVRLAAALLGVLALVSTTGADAGYRAFPITAQELQMLPAYCRQLSPGNYTPAARQFILPGSPPKSLSDVHHYCHGLTYMIRAEMAVGDRGVRRQNLDQAVNNFSYVLRRMPNSLIGSKYSAVVRIRRARALVKLSRYAEAVSDLEAAIKIDPSLTPAYADLSGIYLHMGDGKKARSILLKGLERSPKSRLLRRKMASLQSSDDKQSQDKPKTHENEGTE